MEALEDRHARELQELHDNIKQMLKGAKKSTRAQIEAQAIQMEFDLKAKHREEIEEFEEKGAIQELNSDTQLLTISKTTTPSHETEEEIARQKKAKAKKKQDKRASKEKERAEIKNQILLDTSNQPNPREIELRQLRELLAKEGRILKDIPSDGNCLYRAVADQLMLTNSVGGQTYDFKELRKMAASHIQNNAEEYAPFLGLSGDEVADYCLKVASDTLAEWGGQVELKALGESLKRQIHVYAAGSPIVRMGELNGQEPLRLAFHRHFYALGEHYNSIIPVQQSCGCDC